MAEQREEARLRYIRGTETVNQVAEALGISKKTAQGWCKADGWVKERAKFRKRAAKKAVTMAVGKKARELARLLEASESMEKALLHAAKAFENALTESPERVTDGKFRSGNLRNVAEALQRQSETTMKLSGIVTGAEREKLDMMRRELEIKERKEAQEAREQESGVKIVMERDAEGLAE